MGIKKPRSLRKAINAHCRSFTEDSPKDKHHQYGSLENLIAFHNGEQLTDWLLAYVVNAATRGHITEHGQNLWLIPKNVYERATRDQQKKADREARRQKKKKLPRVPGPASPSIQKGDCIPLTNYLPKTDAELKRRLLRISEYGPLFPMPPHPGTVTHVHGIGVASNRNADCAFCGSIFVRKRCDAKYCSKKCRQAAYRQRGHN
jgi:hypothetical protein